MGKCPRCEKARLNRSPASRDAPYEYTVVGDFVVALSGVSVDRCPECRSVTPVIPEIDQLHREISVFLLRLPILSGSQIRYLRHSADLPSNVLARNVRINPSHLSRVEQGKTRCLGKSADKLLRIIIAAKTGEADLLSSIALTPEPAAAEVGGPKAFHFDGSQWSAADGETSKGSADTLEPSDAGPAPQARDSQQLTSETRQRLVSLLDPGRCQATFWLDPADVELLAQDPFVRRGEYIRQLGDRFRFSMQRFLSDLAQAGETGAASLLGKSVVSREVAASLHGKSGVQRRRESFSD